MKIAQNIKEVNQVNRSIVLLLLLENKKISRNDLARTSNLNKATISNIINEFIDTGIVSECGTILDSNGRKTTGITLTLSNVIILVVRLNRGFINFAVCSMRGEILEQTEQEFSLDEKIEVILESIRSGIDSIICNHQNKIVLAISVAVLGPLVNGIIKAYDMPELSKLNIEEEIQKMYPDIKVFLDNDAHMSVHAEWRDYKLENNCKEGVLVNLIFGEGIDAGIMIDGRPLRGSMGIAGDVGNININFDVGEQIPMNYKGILENYASPKVMHREVIAKLDARMDTEITVDSSLDDIYKLYVKGDPLAIWALDRMCWFLAYGISSFVYILNPNTIVLGGQIIVSDVFLDKLKDNMAEFLSTDIMDEIDIKYSKHSDGGVIAGSAIKAVNSFLDTLNLDGFLKDNFLVEYNKSSIEFN